MIKTEHVVHMHEQPFDPFEQGKILEFDGEFIREELILNFETHAALLFNSLAEKFKGDVFGRHGNPAVLYLHVRVPCDFFGTGLSPAPECGQARQTEKDQEKEEPWMLSWRRGIHDAFLA
jgi:hypothetical protein